MINNEYLWLNHDRIYHVWNRLILGASNVDPYRAKVNKRGE